MRKISQQAAAALIEGSTYHNGNTRVGDGVMYMHGNAIASYEPHGMRGVYAISLAGWPTVTTKERLNTLLSALGASWYLRTIKGQVYAINRRGGQIELDHDGWYKVKPLEHMNERV